MERNELTIAGYERVVHFSDETFSAYIALHNIRLGPALGGCRICHYPSETAALTDVLNLSKGMSYKNALAGLNFGGGKCVVNADHATPEIMHKVGQAVESLHGQYITAEDVGTTVADMRVLAEDTKFVGSLGAAGDPSPWTALGVYSCIYSVLEHFDVWSMGDASIWVQGLGKVGWRLAEFLVDTDVGDLFLTDLNKERQQHACEMFLAESTLPKDLSRIDLYSPCAMGQVITASNADTLPMIICGSANNQLADDGLAALLHHNGIVYCPDWLVNAGGVIAVAAEIAGFDAERVESNILGLGQRLVDVITEAEKANVAPLQIAINRAEKRLLSGQ